MKKLDFYQGKRVLITGHTGFKGTWLAQILLMAGANVTGYALNPPTTPNLFQLCFLENQMNSIYGDIRDLNHLMNVFSKVQPEIVFHLAAQPIVRESYKNPVNTYETNVMGTVNIMECIRQTLSVKSVVNITTDKVYKNMEWERGYKEEDELNGFDPYSNSKSCSELVTDSYKNSFFQERDIAISTVRAGNVIGGGDFAVDRIIPDCIRAIENGEQIIVRNPYSVRPYQHVLEPLFVYLMIAEKQYNNRKYAGSYNVGPEDEDCLTTGELVTLFCNTWNGKTGDKIDWVTMSNGGPHEDKFLKLNCNKLKQTFGWIQEWNINITMTKIVEWYSEYHRNMDITNSMQRQIREFIQQDNK